MQVSTVNISELYGLQGSATLECITHDTYRDDFALPARPTVIVVPGGGYAMVSKREGEPIASYYLAKGYNTFILTYSVAPISYPTQLLQLSATVDYLHANAETLHVDENAIFIVGFSAGGHLVANFATDYMNVNAKFGKEWKLGATAVCLSYPVITSVLSYKDTHTNLLSAYSGAEHEALMKELNLDERVTAQTLPSFVWTTAQDNCVPPQNSLMYTSACLEHGVRCELHMFPDGWHGLSTCDEQTNDGDQPFFAKNHNWLALSEDFFRTCIK